MSEDPGVRTASADVTGRVAAMALRVAGLVRDHSGPDTGGPDAAAFLQRWAESVPARPVEELAEIANDTPLARLSESLGLSPLEVNLLLLAGLPEEHEGL